MLSVVEHTIILCNIEKEKMLEEKCMEILESTG